MSGARPSPARAALVMCCALIGVWLVVPALVAFPMSFTGERTFQFPPRSWSTQWWDGFFRDPTWMSALWTSLKVALVVTIIATLLGTAAAFGIVRGRFRGRSLVRTLFVAPLVVPIIVIALGVYATFLKWGLAGTFAGFVLAHTVLAVPFVVITVSASLQTFDRTLEAAAASLGAGPWTTFRLVTLPVVAPGVLTGALFAFITSFDEVVVSLFLATPFNRTMPVQLYLSVTQSIDPTIAVAATIMITSTTALLLLAALVMKGRGRLVPD